MLSRSQQLGRAVRQAKSKARLNILCRCSAEGMSKLEAAAQAQLSEAGADTLLYKVFKTTAWPIPTAALAKVQS